MKEYPSLNGLQRSAMIFGMPIMGFLLITTVIGVVLGLSMMFGGVKGLFVIPIAVPFIFYLRKLSANDDQGFRINMLELLMLFKKRQDTYRLVRNPARGKRIQNEYKRYLQSVYTPKR